MKIKGLKKSVQYAKAFPSSFYVSWFAHPIKGGWEVNTTDYIPINIWLTNFDPQKGRFYLNEIMHTVSDRYEYDNGKKPSLTMMVRLACNVLESRIDRVRE